MKNKLQKLYWILTLCCITTTLEAAPVDYESAREKARLFFNQHTARGLTEGDIRLKGNTANAYLFTTEKDFAIIAADDELPDILGYGATSQGEIPPALQNYLKAPKHPAHPSRTLQHYEPVAPLLPFVRHQLSPYNNQCPLYKTSQGVITQYHCVVGCVATALEEIISYYRRVVTLKDTLHGWETPKYTIADLLPGTSVDCRLIRNNYDTDDYTAAEEDAVARLSYYCGVAAHMNWGINESGANVHNLVDPMKRAFGYQYVHFADSYQYKPADWTRMMRNEIYAHRPVLYAAFNMWWAGHAFVLDGLDENGFFHVNWGYGGSYDGFFCLDVLNYNEPPEQMTPDASEAGFYSNHQALLLHPDPVEVALPDTLHRTGYEIAVDSVKMELIPETDKHTPLAVYVRNTTDQYLTTPLAFFTNSVKDTAIYEQADYIALGASRLAPFEARKIIIHANFNKQGDRILRITPDNEALVYEQKINIEQGKAPELSFRRPEITFPSPTAAMVTLTVNNSKNAGRCGQEILYEMGPGTAEVMEDGIRHSRQLYVLPGETLTDTITFTHLTPGETYTLLIRSPWKVTTQTTFIQPKAAGITNIPTRNTKGEISWYLLDGRQINLPRRTGIYLKKENGKCRKVYIEK